MRHNKAMKFLGVLSVGVLAVTACGDDSDDDDASTTGDEEGTVDETEVDVVNSGMLTVCTDAPYEPFEFEEDGEWTGFDMELMRNIAEQMDLELDVVVQPFEGIWLAPAAGNCDIVASAMTITEERAENALFSDPYFEADQSLLVRSEDADDFETLDDLDGHTIGAQSDTTGLTYANENAPDGATIEEFEEEVGIFGALESGGVDAVLQDLPVNGWRAVQSDGDLVVVETYTTDEQYGFATTLENEALIEVVNTALADMREDGTYDDLHADWFGETAE
jgi:polar amino acid transport system substrate-binding protein